MDVSKIQGPGDSAFPNKLDVVLSDDEWPQLVCLGVGLVGQIVRPEHAEFIQRVCNAALAPQQAAPSDAKSQFEVWATTNSTYDLRPAKVTMLSVGGVPYEGYVRPYLQDRTVHAYEGFCAALAKPAAPSEAAPVAVVAIEALTRYSKSCMEGGGVCPDQQGGYIKRADVLAALAPQPAAPSEAARADAENAGGLSVRQCRQKDHKHGTWIDLIDGSGVEPILMQAPELYEFRTLYRRPAAVIAGGLDELQAIGNYLSSRTKLDSVTVAKAAADIVKMLRSAAMGAARLSDDEIMALYHETEPKNRDPFSGVLHEWVHAFARAIEARHYRLGGA